MLLSRVLLFRFGLLAAVAVAGVATLKAEDADRKFLAGASTSNITPPLGEMIVGNWKPIPATNIHDELHARSLVLDNGETRLAIVLCDNVGIPVEVFDLAKQHVQEATGIAPSHILMAATHTHSATTARGSSKVHRDESLTDYQRFLARRISDGVRRAVANLQEAEIAWGSVDEPSEVFNRRWFVDDAALLKNPFGGLDRVRMNPPRGHKSLNRPAGPVDPEISFISVRHRDGRPLAVLANYSLHYVGGVNPGDVSADYFGYFAKFIEQKLLGDDEQGGDRSWPPFVGILSNGTSGDINNINFQDGKPKRYRRYEKMAEVADKVAQRVADAHRDLTFHSWVPLDAQATDLRLNVRKPSEEMRAHFANLDASDAPRMGREQIYAERVAKLDAGPEAIDVPLQTLRIGTLGIAAIPFETFAETGLEIKRESPFEQSFTIELANGSFGYLPTPEQHRLGGYETWMGSNNVQKDASVKIVDALMEMFGRLHQE
ncbi:neutral/alkaline non-lysosomal ceramidase N-terminal domain-containing protein [Roseimaritima sediminicola]|uniref:neutral/alkaline non-lysosomal ceramidase N-terminal domain-containing protein n=1 Tax=Roseimaritima sediminicola TaxID=2662066 RepID=UPI0013873290|nr:neutral/alkaline non-lysosomal ceramidase N-terminal domain-containing protein [Roseimaritima sediminicola]